MSFSFLLLVTNDDLFILTPLKLNSSLLSAWKKLHWLPSAWLLLTCMKVTHCVFWCYFSRLTWKLKDYIEYISRWTAKKTDFLWCARQFWIYFAYLYVYHLSLIRILLAHMEGTPGICLELLHKNQRRFCNIIGHDLTFPSP